MNASFGWDMTLDRIRTARDGMANHLHYLKQNIHPSQMAFYIAESPHYAAYRLAERFGLLSEPIEEMDRYGTVKPKHLEVLRI